jgi:hypothetical protein
MSKARFVRLVGAKRKIVHSVKQTASVFLGWDVDMTRCGTLLWKDDRTFKSIPDGHRLCKHCVRVMEREEELSWCDVKTVPRSTSQPRA